MGRVSGKVALITGAGDGIGKATAKLYASQGATVFCVSRTPSKLEAVVADINAAGGKAAFAAGDLSKPADAERAFAAALAAYGRVDILVNAAGVGYSWADKSPGTMNETISTTPEAWREVMAINLDSVFYMCRAALTHMQPRRTGVIVNVASIYGMMGVANAHAYTATKGALINYTRSLAVTYVADGIRSNCLAPGFIDTGMVASVTPLFQDAAIAKQISPMGRPGTPEEMAYACLYLGCDESSYCNGTVLVADGGSLSQ